MDLIEMKLGVQKLEEAMANLEEAQEFFKKAFGSSDILKMMLAMRNQGWVGDEIQLLIESHETIDIVSKKFSKTKSNNASTWKQRMAAELWKFVEPIAESVDVAKMTTHYFNQGRETLLDETSTLEFAMYDYLVNCLTHPKDCGINISVEEVVAKCDLEAYAAYVRLKDEDYAVEDDNVTKWAFHLLSNFFDTLVVIDKLPPLEYTARIASNAVYERMCGVQNK